MLAYKSYSHTMETKEQVDITRFNRKKRRELRQRIHITIPGRNLPFVKAIHKTIENFDAMRAKEIEADIKEHGGKVD